MGVGSFPRWSEVEEQGGAGGNRMGRGGEKAKRGGGGGIKGRRHKGGETLLLAGGSP